jgi:hypothetical protein
MRLVKGIVAVACFLMGLWLMLRAAGVLIAVLRIVLHWWPTLPLVVGAAILIRSPRPGPHRGASAVLIGASCMAFAIVHRLIAVSVWPFAASAGLMAAGLVLAHLAVGGSPAKGTGRYQRVVVAFRSAVVLPEMSADLTRIQVYVFCGRLELDTRECLPEGWFPDEAVMIEITVCLGNVTVVRHPKVRINHHEAFAMRLGRPVSGRVLSDEDTRQAPAVVATLGFFGGVDLREKDPVAVSPGN